MYCTGLKSCTFPCETNSNKNFAASNAFRITLAILCSSLNLLKAVIDQNKNYVKFKISNEKELLQSKPSKLKWKTIETKYAGCVGVSH